MSSFLGLSDIKNLQIDHTTSCNLLCPQCSRVVGGKRNPSLPTADLKPEDYQSLLAQLTSPLETILFCGNYGDVAASSTFLDCIKTIKQLTSAKLTMMTNGSLRTPEWWAELAHLLDPQRDKVCWSIDGLADTNPLYRVNSRFDKIMENAKSFIAAGGRARWDYIAFQHNEHQIEEAQKLATDLGFFMFSLKRTSRFIIDSHFRTNNKYEGSNDKLEVPKNKDLVSEGHKKFNDIIETYSSWENYIRETPISCKFKTTSTLFIDFEMRVWPCCWIAAPVYFHDQNNSQKKQLLAVLERFPKNFNSLHHNSLSKILESAWYNSLLVESWGKDHPARLSTCSRTCGKDYDYSASTNKNRDFIPLTPRFPL